MKDLINGLQAAGLNPIVIDEDTDFEQLARPRFKTNVEFVADLMNFARSGPLMQAFIIEAMARYAAECLEHPADTFDSPLLSGKAWLACAAELDAAIKARA